MEKKKFIKFINKTHKFVNDLKKPFIDILIYLVLTLIVNIPLEYVKDSAVLSNIFMIIGSLIVAIVMCLRSNIDFKKEFKDFKKNYKSHLESGLKTWFIGFVLMFLTNFIIVSFLMNGEIANNEELNREMIAVYPIYAVLSMAIFAPIIEELMFRFNFRKAFKSKKAYMYFTGILFGLLHVLLNCTSILDFLYVIPYSIVGIAFGKIYADSKNILTSMFIHSFHNVLSLIIVFSGL